MTTNETSMDEILMVQGGYMEGIFNTYKNTIIRANYPYSSAENPLAFYQFEFKGPRWEPHYQLYWAWIAVDYVSGLFLLASSTFSFWSRKDTLAPDIFGFVSSLTRDNPHFPVPFDGSTLDSVSRSRAFRDFKVKIGDVNDTRTGHGKLGFVPMVDAVHVLALSKERKYI